MPGRQASFLEEIKNCWPSLACWQADTALWKGSGLTFSRYRPDHRLVLGAGLAALGEELFLQVRVEAVIDDAGEVTEAGGEAGLRVPSI